MERNSTATHIQLRCALETDSGELTSISFAAKNFWNYPDEYMEKWSNELTVSPDYIKYNRVICAIQGDNILGFYSIFKLDNDMKFSNVYLEKGYWLDHMFIRPIYHNRGIGKLFFTDINQYLNSNSDSNGLKIFVDPNATGFYEKMGAKLFRISESSIPGRLIPVYEYTATDNKE